MKKYIVCTAFLMITFISYCLPLFAEIFIPIIPHPYPPSPPPNSGWGGSHTTNSDAHAVPLGGNAGIAAGTTIQTKGQETANKEPGVNNQPLLLEAKQSNAVQKD